MGMQQVDLEQIRYSMVWEDGRLLSKALGVRAGDSVLSISSAGCNVLELILQSPKKLVAIDVSPAQNRCLRLKLTAIEHLAHEEFTALVGLTSSLNRHQIFEKLIPYLSSEDLQFWNRQLGFFEYGLLSIGRLEKYFKAFRTEYLFKKFPTESISFLKGNTSLAKQLAWLEESNNFIILQEGVQEYFNRDSLGAKGRDPIQFQYVTEDQVAKVFFNRFFNELKRTCVNESYYLSLFLLGEVPDAAYWPLAYQSISYPKLKEGRSRITIETQDLDAYLQKTRRQEYFDCFNLSDIFEYLSQDQTQHLLASLAKASNPHARLAFWNLLVTRAPDSNSQWKTNFEKSKQLSSIDRVWFYQDFFLTERQGDAEVWLEPKSII